MYCYSSIQMMQAAQYSTWATSRQFQLQMRTDSLLQQTPVLLVLWVSEFFKHMTRESDFRVRRGMPSDGSMQFLLTVYQVPQVFDPPPPPPSY